MTLNLIGVSEGVVCQSSDFRLTYLDGYTTDHEVQKIFPAITFNWTAWIQFTGLAKRADGFSTERWLFQETSKLQRESSVESLLEILMGAQTVVGLRDHLTFTVIGFEHRRPFVHLISNFESLNRGSSAISGKGWRISSAKPVRGEALAFATGAIDHVDHKHLRRIKHCLKKRYEPKRLHSLLAEINRQAAKSAGPNGPISQSCFTAHLQSDGAGEAIPHDVNPGGEYLPAFSVRGIPGMAGPELWLRPKLGDDGQPMPRRLVGMTMAKSAPHDMFAVLSVFRNVLDPDPVTNPLIGSSKR